LLRRLNNPTVALQAFLLTRFAGVLLAGIGLSRLLGLGHTLQAWESLWLLGTALTFALRTGICNHFLPAWHSSSAPNTLLRNTQWLADALALGAALLFIPIGFWLVGQADTALVLPLALYLFFQTATMLAEFYLHAKGRVGALYTLGFVGNLAPTFVLIGAVYLGFGIETSVWVFVLCHAVRWAVCMILMGGWKPRIWAPEGKALKLQFRHILPLAGVALAASSGEYFDGFLVKWLVPEQFVLFRYGARELPYSLLLANATALAAAGDIAAGIQANVRGLAFDKLRQSQTRLLHVTVPISIALLLASDWLFAQVYGPAFVPAAGVFVWFLLLNIPRMAMPQAVLNGVGQQNLLFRASLWELALRLSLAVVLVPFLGIVGAAIGTVIAYCFEKALLAWWLWRQGIAPKAYLPLGWLGFYSLLMLAAFLLRLLLR
jgi:O-antigen/teichoic acid export membrane protein